MSQEEGLWGPLGSCMGVLCPSRHLLSSCSLGLAAWEEYPTLKMLMEMVMTKYVGTCCWDRTPGWASHAGQAPGS